MSSNLLEVSDLHVSFGNVPVVKGVSLSVAPGETLGIIGESGSGKSVTARALSYLLPGNARMQRASHRFDGKDMLKAGRAEIDALRGSGWAMIFQDPSGAFNPVKRIEWHMHHVLQRAASANRKLRPDARRGDERQTAKALLDAVGITSPERVLHSYPFQLSGGMLQRVLIAMVSAMQPRLIIADEPTTNLDKVIENQILDLLTETRERMNAAVILITHDLLVAQRTCQRIAVMYGGRIVETNRADVLLDNPQHPYTQALLESSRSLARGDARLKEISADLKERLIAFDGLAEPVA